MRIVPKIRLQEALHLPLQAVRIDPVLRGNLKEGVLSAAVIKSHCSLQWDIGRMDGGSHLHHHAVSAVCLVNSYHREKNISVARLCRDLLTYRILIILPEKPFCGICGNKAGILSFIEIRWRKHRALNHIY